MPKKIFIGDLSGITTVSTINSNFSPYGTIVSTDLHTNPTGGPSTCDLEYTTDQAGTDAIDNMNGATIDGATIVVRPADT
ncbi:MAG: hypothetical protein R3A79_04035 [Nannocystaceae bacterium]